MTGMVTDFETADQERETREWVDALRYVIEHGGPERATALVDVLKDELYRHRIELPFSATTPYVNTIRVEEQPPYPGAIDLERRIRSLVRWNAMAMVVRANRESPGIGGHISTYASVATLYEVGFNHFFKAKNDQQNGDQIYFQGHSSPGIYARAFLEGRLSEQQLANFRRELQPGGGLPSYPHPWLMRDFWQFPTVSMGLGPLMSIYQARFNRYLENRRLSDTGDSHVWCFLGDGECDEPETLGSVSLAAREGLDNLIWVVNCNLQRLDGPVRGNGKVIQELEAVFRGAGWNVIKVIWGADWDPLLAQDDEGWLVRRMEEALDGDYQKYVVSDGRYIREHFFGKYPALEAMADPLSDEQLRRMRRGGHDSQKVHAAYKAAIAFKGAPTVILAKTIKGYGLGEAGEGKNVTHQQKKLNERELTQFRARFGIPISNADVADAPFYRPSEDSPEIQYLKNRRDELGGYTPNRIVHSEELSMPPDEVYREFYEGTGDRSVSTMMALARMLTRLLKDPHLGKRIVPIIPDEARTFGLDPLFRQCGIYSSIGQLYEPVDRDTLLYYREAQDGQILEEGITEAGSMCSFIAAGTSYTTHSLNMIPFFLYYSMFGYQRMGDLIWAASEMQAKGFMMGGTAGRTSLAGEGLQHQDGHSQLFMSVVPTVRTYDPAYAYELAVIVREGLRLMYEKQETAIYYCTVYNENYPMPPMPEGVTEGILRGMYLVHRSERSTRDSAQVINLFGSGSLLREALRAASILEDKFDIAPNVWSVTSYNMLRRECLEVDRWNRLHPLKEPRQPYVVRVLGQQPVPTVAVSDYVSMVPEQIAPWLPGRMVSLGTDGFGRSEDRASLRRHFEIDAECIVVAALHALAVEHKMPRDVVTAAIKEFNLSTESMHPMDS